MDVETQRYVDASMRAVRAENDSRFAQVLSRLDGMNPATWWQIAVLIAGAIGSVFAILAFASDRFDSGVNSMGAVGEAINRQMEINAAQDERLDRIINALEAKGGDDEGR